MIGLETQLGAVRQRFPGAPETSRVLLLGEDNPLSTEPHFALYCEPDGCAGQRLQAQVLDLPRAVYLGIWRTNLCVGGWSAPKARERARELMRGQHPWEVIVALGAKVASALRSADGSTATAKWPAFSRWPLLRYTDGPPGEVREHMGAIVVIPHPSGRNPIWDTDPSARFKARALVAEAAPELFQAWGAR